MQARKRVRRRSQTSIQRGDGSQGFSPSALEADYAQLLENYSKLIEGVRMLRRAAERASRTGLLPPIDHSRRTPLQECEAITRAIYRAAQKHARQSTLPLAGLSHDP